MGWCFSERIVKISSTISLDTVWLTCDLNVCLCVDEHVNGVGLFFLGLWVVLQSGVWLAGWCWQVGWHAGRTAWLIILWWGNIYPESSVVFWSWFERIVTQGNWKKERICFCFIYLNNFWISYLSLYFWDEGFGILAGAKYTGSVLRLGFWKSLLFFTPFKPFFGKTIASSTKRENASQSR